MIKEPRVTSWFSMGMASAYATFLANEKYGDRMTAVYCKVAEEIDDGFDTAFVDAFGIPIKQIQSERYGPEASIYEVFRARKFIKGPSGAPCTMVLKKWAREDYERPTDIQVFGYTAEEGKRVDQFHDANNHVDTDFILYDRGISKKECMEWGMDNNLPIATMYKLGYPNNNCVGCVKGGMGYWNAIRRDFPDAFNKMAKLERQLGHAVNKDKDGPVFLDVLDVNRGRFSRDVPADCGFTCELKD